MDEERFRELLSRVAVSASQIVELLLREEARTKVLLSALMESLHQSDIVDRERFDPWMSQYFREHEEATRAGLRQHFAMQLMREIRGPADEIGEEEE